MMTFESAAGMYMAANAAHMKPATQARYGSNLRRHLLPAFGGMDVTAIRRGDVAAFCAGKLSDGLSPKTVNCLLTLLKSILSFVRRELELPVADITGISARKPGKPLRVLTLAEQKRLTAYVAAHLTAANVGILMGLYCGLRVGEVCGLKWSDLSLTERTVNVRRTVLRVQAQYAPEPERAAAAAAGRKTAVLLQTPKSESSRRAIPLPDALVPLLKQVGRGQSGFLLTGTDSPFEPHRMEDVFHRAARACGIQDASFHALRHSMATRCIELGADVKSLSEILGHSNVTITLQKYVHPSMQLKRRHMNQLGRLLNPL